MRMFLATVLAVAAVAAPTATTGDAAGVTATNATLEGTVDPGNAPTSYHFEYGTTTAYGVSTPPQDLPAGGDPVPVEAAIEGLTAETTYHYRLVASNGDGVDFGEDRTFTTAANPSPPEVIRPRVRDVLPDRATLTATLDTNGGETTYRFEYGTSTRYGSVTPVRTAAVAAEPVAIAETVTGLAPRTRYHWRMVATNAAGTTRGRDREFTTSRLPTAITLALSPRTVTWSRPLALGGRAAGAGVGNMRIALEAQRFPFTAGFAEVSTGRTGRDGGYLFRVPNVWTTTRYRVVTRTKASVTSPVATASSAVLVSRRARHRSRRRARIEGSVLPAVTGVALLQRRRDGAWHDVRSKPIAPSDELRSRYRFKVRRAKTKRKRMRVRVEPVAGGAHVAGKSRRLWVKKRPRRR